MKPGTWYYYCILSKACYCCMHVRSQWLRISRPIQSGKLQQQFSSARRCRRSSTCQQVHTDTPLFHLTDLSFTVLLHIFSHKHTALMPIFQASCVVQLPLIFLKENPVDSSSRFSQTGCHFCAHCLMFCRTKPHTHTHTRLTALCPGLPGWAGTRKVKPIWILLKQETVSGSCISWAICKSASHSRQITTPASHYSDFYRPDAFPASQRTASKHWRHT